MSNVRKPRKGLANRVHLEVTQEIIDRAVRRDSTACVLADALKIAIPGGTRPLVDLQTISISVPERGLRYHWLTPRPAQRLLINFDQGAQLIPGTVDLRHGWTTPIDKHHQRRFGGKDSKSRAERKQELEQKEKAGMLNANEKRALKTMRDNDARAAQQPKHAPDRTLADGGRPPMASLSNSRGRRYGLRLTRLTEHGERLVDG